MSNGFPTGISGGKGGGAGDAGGASVAASSSPHFFEAVSRVSFAGAAAAWAADHSRRPQRETGGARSILGYPCINGEAMGHASDLGCRP